MYGQNGRIGLLVPSANTVAEPEFNRMVPDGIGVHAARMQYLEDEGIRVLTVAGMGIVDAFSIGKVTPQETYEFARRVWRGDAGGMFISCTNLRTIDVLARLEAELGAPVVSMQPGDVPGLSASPGTSRARRGVRQASGKGASCAADGWTHPTTAC